MFAYESHDHDWHRPPHRRFGELGRVVKGFGSSRWEGQGGIDRAPAWLVAHYRFPQTEMY